jgi:hypothetical protein
VDATTIIGTGTKYSDPDFPANDALYWADYSLGMGANAGYLTFDRAKAHFPTANLYDIIDNTDIRQMSLGDCYFLASCSALGEYANRLTGAFVRNTLPAEGIVQVNAYVLGNKKTITMDDYLAFYKQSGTNLASNSLAFAQPSPTGELWGPFLEKAFAKVSGNFEVIEGGWMSEALAFLSGAPSKTYSIGSMSMTTVWSTISDADTKKHIITAGTASDPSGHSAINQYGLAKNHAYTVIGVNTLTLSDGSTLQMMKMRNPWGEDGQYNGTFNDLSSIWNTAGSNG